MWNPLDLFKSPADLSQTLEAMSPDSIAPVPKAEEEEIIQRGTQLDYLRGSAGWQHVLKWLNDQCDKADLKMLSSESADPLVLIGLQRSARSYRKIHDELQLYVDSQIQAARDILVARAAAERDRKVFANEEREPLYG